MFVLENNNKNIQTYTYSGLKNKRITIYAKQKKCFWTKSKSENNEVVAYTCMTCIQHIRNFNINK